jgi:hypothetical protein
MTSVSRISAWSFESNAINIQVLGHPVALNQAKENKQHLSSHKSKGKDRNAQTYWEQDLLVNIV